MSPTDTADAEIERLKNVLLIARAALKGEPTEMLVNGQRAMSIVMPAYAIDVIDNALKEKKTDG